MQLLYFHMLSLHRRPRPAIAHPEDRGPRVTYRSFHVRLETQSLILIYKQLRYEIKFIYDLHYCFRCLYEKTKSFQLFMIT